MKLIRNLRSNSALKILLVLLGLLYVIASMMPKHGDYWTILNISMGFVVNPSDFLSMKYVVYPPTFYELQGAWLKVGASLFHYDFTFNPELANSTLYTKASFELFPFWGMIPMLAALFVFVGVAYVTLKNKWLSLLCLGPITFVAVIFMGQIDVFCALFIFISLALMLKALKAKNYVPFLLLGYLSLGISMQFKTYGGSLFPLYLLYTASLLRERKPDLLKATFTALTCVFLFGVAMVIVWIPYIGWLNKIMFGGTSGWLSLTSPLFQSQVPVWLIGYVLMLCYMAVRILGNPKVILQDNRYFTFYSFLIVAWFVIAVYTHPQWWMFLVPIALLVVDNFQDKNSILLCIVTSAIFLLYPIRWPEIVVLYPVYFGRLGVIAQYAVPAFFGRSLFAWIHLFLTGSLLLWIWGMAQELRNHKPIDDH